MKARYVLDKSVLEAIPLAEGPDNKGKSIMLSTLGIRGLVEFLHKIKGQAVALPACWRSDLLHTEIVMAPLDFEADTEGEFVDLTMEDMVNDFLDAHEQINNYFHIHEKPFTADMVERLKELYFYLPVEYFSPEMLITYQYAAFAWSLDLPFYTRNIAFYAAIHPEAHHEYTIMAEPAPERRLIYQPKGEPISADLSARLNWVHLLADTDKEKSRYEFIECIQR